LPSYLQPLSRLETVVFDPRLRTAAELVAMSFSPVAQHVPRGSDSGLLGIGARRQWRTDSRSRAGSSRRKRTNFGASNNRHPRSTRDIARTVTGRGTVSRHTPGGPLVNEGIHGAEDGCFSVQSTTGHSRIVVGPSPRVATDISRRWAPAPMRGRGPTTSDLMVKTPRSYVRGVDWDPYVVLKVVWTSEPNPTSETTAALRIRVRAVKNLWLGVDNCCDISP